MPDKNEDAIIHRDLRLSNLLLDNQELYLVDFGMARYLDPNRFPGSPDPPLRTPKAFPPHQRKPGSRTYNLLRTEISPQSDLFGAGVVAIDLLTNWVSDESQFQQPWQEVLPISQPFIGYLEDLFSQHFQSASEAAQALQSCPKPG